MPRGRCRLRAAPPPGVRGARFAHSTTFFRAFQVALLEEGADWVSYVAGAAGPDGYTDVISPAEARRLQRGDVLMLDTGAVSRRLFL